MFLFDPSGNALEFKVCVRVCENQFTGVLLLRDVCHGYISLGVQGVCRGCTPWECPLASAAQVRHACWFTSGHTHQSSPPLLPTPPRP